MGLGDKVKVLEGDLRDVDVEEPVEGWRTTCVYVYLLPEGLEVIKDSIGEWLRGGEGRKCVCNTWGFKGWRERGVEKVGEFNDTLLIVYNKCSVDDSLGSDGT